MSACSRQCGHRHTTRSKTLRSGVGCILCAALRALKDELQDRGELFKGSGAAETVRETEYALGQIEWYVMGNESVIVDESSGQVFAESLRLRWNDLVSLVDELDADYRADTADQSPEP